MTMHRSLRTQPTGRPKSSSRTCKGQKAASQRKRDIRSGVRPHRDFSDMAGLPFVDLEEQRRQERLLYIDNDRY